MFAACGDSPYSPQPENVFSNFMVSDVGPICIWRLFLVGVPSVQTVVKILREIKLEVCTDWRYNLQPSTGMEFWSSALIFCLFVFPFLILLSVSLIETSGKNGIWFRNTNSDIHLVKFMFSRIFWKTDEPGPWLMSCVFMQTSSSEASCTHCRGSIVFKASYIHERGTEKHLLTSKVVIFGLDHSGARLIYNIHCYWWAQILLRRFSRRKWLNKLIMRVKMLLIFS